MYWDWNSSWNEAHSNPWILKESIYCNTRNQTGRGRGIHFATKRMKLVSRLETGPISFYRSVWAGHISRIQCLGQRLLWLDLQTTRFHIQGKNFMTLVESSWTHTTQPYIKTSLRLYNLNVWSRFSHWVFLYLFVTLVLPRGLPR